MTPRIRNLDQPSKPRSRYCSKCGVAPAPHVVATTRWCESCWGWVEPAARRMAEKRGETFEDVLRTVYATRHR